MGAWIGFFESGSGVRRCHATVLNMNSSQRKAANSKSRRKSHRVRLTKISLCWFRFSPILEMAWCGSHRWALQAIPTRLTPSFWIANPKKSRSTPTRKFWSADASRPPLAYVAADRPQHWISPHVYRGLFAGLSQSALGDLRRTHGQVNADEVPIVEACDSCPSC